MPCIGPTFCDASGPEKWMVYEVLKKPISLSTSVIPSGPIAESALSSDSTTDAGAWMVMSSVVWPRKMSLNCPSRPLSVDPLHLAAADGIRRTGGAVDVFGRRPVFEMALADFAVEGRDDAADVERARTG